MTEPTRGGPDECDIGAGVVDHNYDPDHHIQSRGLKISFLGDLGDMAEGSSSFQDLMESSIAATYRLIDTDLPLFYLGAISPHDAPSQVVQ